MIYHPIKQQYLFVSVFLEKNIKICTNETCILYLLTIFPFFFSSYNTEMRRMPRANSGPVHLESGGQNVARQMPPMFRLQSPTYR